MISKVELGSVNSKNKSPQIASIKQNNAVQFTGLGDIVLKGIQTCEANPMVNVSVLDLSTAILPRTYFETFIGSKQKDENGQEHRKLNIFGGFEAFRRESSGLIINCLIPSFIVMGVAKFLNKPIMGDLSGSGLAKSWANSETINKVNQYFTAAQGESEEARIYNTLKSISEDLHGVDGDKERAFKEILADDEAYEQILRKTANNIANGHKELKHSRFKFVEGFKNLFGIKSYKKYTDELYEYVVNKTGIAESIRFTNDKGYSTSNLKHLYDSAGELLNGIVKTDIANDSEQLAAYFKKAGHLVNAKSAIGLGAFIIPLAISAQPINRWITHKLAGKKGAPIYNDDKERILTPDEQKKLTVQKFFAVPLMWAVAGLSMLMERPSLKMFQFKNIFPTMDQARIISAATFSSRIAASEDSNELQENTIRDIATFSSFYFLGDYAAKAIATFLEKHNKDGIKLINRLKPQDGKNIVEKFWNWAKHTKMKSSDELSSIANEALRTKATTMRAWCHVGNIAFSLLSLGVFIPLYTRTQTNKKKQMEQERTTAAQASSATFTQNHIKNESPAFKSFFS